MIALLRCCTRPSNSSSLACIPCPLRQVIHPCQANPLTPPTPLVFPFPRSLLCTTSRTITNAKGAGGPLSIHRRYVIPLDTYAALVDTVASRRPLRYPAILRATRDFSPFCCLENMWQQ